MYDNLILRYLYKSICSYTEWESHFITKPLKNHNESKSSPWTWAAMTSGAILAPALTSQSLGPGWKFRDFGRGKKMSAGRPLNQTIKRADSVENVLDTCVCSYSLALVGWNYYMNYLLQVFKYVVSVIDRYTFIIFGY